MALVCTVSHVIVPDMDPSLCNQVVYVGTGIVQIGRGIRLLGRPQVYLLIVSGVVIEVSVVVQERSPQVCLLRRECVQIVIFGFDVRVGPAYLYPYRARRSRV